MDARPPLPTAEFYGLLQSAYDHFNQELFEGKLPQVILTVQRERNTCGFVSYHRWVRNPSREKVHELAVNPAYFGTGPILEVLQTLVHEQAHIWQQEFGKPVRRAYHDREWAGKMESIGLMPSSSGLPGGKRTGQKMSDYPISGGRFKAAALALVNRGWLLTWVDRHAIGPKRRLPIPSAVPPVSSVQEKPGEEAGPIDKPMELEAAWKALSIKLVDVIPDVMVNTPEKLKERLAKQKVKYTCGCGVNVWGKPALRLICGECGDRFRVFSASPVQEAECEPTREIAP